MGRAQQRDELKAKSVHLSLRGPWERERHLPGARPGVKVEFDRPASSFALRVRVHGPTVRAWVDDELQLTYTTPDGSLLEGFLGVAMGQGAVRLQQPVVRRLDGGGVPATAPIGLDLANKGPADPLDAVGLHTRNLPRAPSGTVVLWIPRAADPDQDLELLARTAPWTDRLLRVTAGLAPHPLLVIPAKWLARLRSRLAAKIPMLPHAAAPLPGDATARVGFLDGLGVLRAAAVWKGRGGLPGVVARWAERYRPPPDPFSR